MLYVTAPDCQLRKSFRWNSDDFRLFLLPRVDHQQQKSHMDQESKYYGNWRQLNIMWRHQNRFRYVAPPQLKILNFEAWRYYRLQIQKIIEFSDFQSHDATSPSCNFGKVNSYRLIKEKLNKITLVLKRYNFTAFSRFIIEVSCNFRENLFLIDQIS